MSYNNRCLAHSDEELVAAVAAHERELELVRLGETAQELATELDISEKTLSNHLRRLRDEGRVEPMPDPRLPCRSVWRLTDSERGDK
jgi:DNA-binding HxlR family transcriptional regulator